MEFFCPAFVVMVSEKSLAAAKWENVVDGPYKVFEDVRSFMMTG